MVYELSGRITHISELPRTKTGIPRTVFHIALHNTSRQTVVTAFGSEFQGVFDIDDNVSVTFDLSHSKSQNNANAFPIINVITIETT
jgi:hypothetical protein